MSGDVFDIPGVLRIVSIDRRHVYQSKAFRFQKREPPSVDFFPEWFLSRRIFWNLRIGMRDGVYMYSRVRQPMVRDTFSQSRLVSSHLDASASFGEQPPYNFVRLILGLSSTQVLLSCARSDFVVAFLFAITKLDLSGNVRVSGVSLL